MTTDRKFTQQQTDQFWRERGRDAAQEGLTTTGTDPSQTVVQVAAIMSYLRPEDRVLDVGCGVGDNTLRFAEVVSFVKGLEFSDTLYGLALDRQREQGATNVEFVRNDITQFSSSEEFDKVVSIQCLINLMSVTDQHRAIQNIHRSLRPGGTYLMLEPSKQGLESLNKYRVALGLSAIHESQHNNNFDEPSLLEFLRPHFRLVSRNRTLATYYFISRVFHPFYVGPQQPEFESRINEVAADIALKFPYISDIECSPLYVLEKR